MKREKYYSLRNIMNENADYNIIIGERSNGKSYAVLEYILNEYLRSKNQGVYLRRFKEDITIKRMITLFTPFNIEKITGGEYNTVIFSHSCFYLGKKTNDNDKVQADTTPFCFALCLSDNEHDKSTSYPNVTTIFFDEFLTRTFYLKEEFILFMNSISTIARDRENIKIFMCGNTVNSYSPYFEEMGLTNIKKQIQGTIDIYTYSNNNLKVAVEYCNSMKRADKKSNKYFAFNNPRLQMITSGKWEIGNYLHLPIDYRIDERKKVFIFYIGFNGDNIQLNVISDNDVFIYIHRKTTPIKENELYFNLNNNIISPYRRRNILLDNLPMLGKIKDIMNSGKVYYSSNEIGEVLRNYLNVCKKI